MSDLIKLEQLIKKDRQLQQRLQSVKTHKDFVNLTLQLAKEKGLHVSAADVNAKLATHKKGELNAADLEAVAGGWNITTICAGTHCA